MPPITRYIAPVALAILATATLPALPLTSASGEDSDQAWSDKPGFQRGEGTPADTGEAGEKCQGISDENRKIECVRKARIKTETAQEKKEIEQAASSPEEAAQKKAELEKEAKQEEKEVEKAAKEEAEKAKKAGSAR